MGHPIIGDDLYFELGAAAPLLHSLPLFTRSLKSSEGGARSQEDETASVSGGGEVVAAAVASTCRKDTTASISESDFECTAQSEFVGQESASKIMRDKAVKQWSSGCYRSYGLLLQSCSVTFRHPLSPHSLLPINVPEVPKFESMRLQCAQFWEKVHLSALQENNI